MFSLLIPDSPKELGAEGSILFGGYDYTKMEGSIDWVNTFNDFMW